MPYDKHRPMKTFDPEALKEKHRRGRPGGSPEEIRCPVKGCGKKLMEVTIEPGEYPLSPEVSIQTVCQRCGAKIEVAYKRDFFGIQRLVKIALTDRKK